MNQYKDTRNNIQNQAGRSKILSAKIPLINVMDPVTLMNLIQVPFDHCEFIEFLMIIMKLIVKWQKKIFFLPKAHFFQVFEYESSYDFSWLIGISLCNKVRGWSHCSIATLRYLAANQIFLTSFTEDCKSSGGWGIRLISVRGKAPWGVHSLLDFHISHFESCALWEQPLVLNIVYTADSGQWGGEGMSPDSGDPQSHTSPVH